MAVSACCWIRHRRCGASAFQLLMAGSFLLFLPLASSGDQLRFDTAREWQQWQLPLGAVELTPDGTIKPVEIRKNIDAILNAADFEGGIHDAGSNRQDAPLVIDGDPTTGWSPDERDDADDWFIEVDLGRAVSANSVTLVFDAEAPPFELFDLLLSTGEPETDNIAAPVEGSLVYRVKERFKENEKHRVTFAIEQIDFTPIQYLRVENLLHVPGARLVEVEVEAIGDNISLGLMERGGIVDVNINLASNSPQPLGKSLALIDGNLYERWRAGTASRAAVDIDAHMILDLGAVYGVDLVRVIGGVVVRSGFGGGIDTNHYISRRRWDFRFYELMTSDGSLSPDGTRIWTKHFSGEAPVGERSHGLVDHHFDLIPTRYVRIFWKFWDTQCFSFFRPGESANVSTIPGCAAGGTTDEIMIFGEGYPREVQLHSPLIDLQGDKNLNVIRWEADTPPGTRVEISTRTGNEVVEAYVFHDKNGKEVTEKKWNKLIPSFRGPIDTTFAVGGDWSPWSKLYAFSGQEFQSPSPRRYLEMDVKLVSDVADAAAALDFLALDFTPPLARRALGEIYPIEIQPGRSTELSYYLRPIQTQGGGFDRLQMESSASVSFIGAALQGEEIEVESEATETALPLTFQQSIRSDQLVELRFESSVFLQSTRFDVFLADSRQGEDIRQRVDPGDASDAVESSRTVVSLPVSRSLLENVELNTAIFTPNGDGINDRLELSFDLVNVLEARPLRLRLFDLAGRLFYEQELEAVAGGQRFTWDGGDASGQRVSPGIYIFELHVAGDAGDESVRRLISVAY